MGVGGGRGLFDLFINAAYSSSDQETEAERYSRERDRERGGWRGRENRSSMNTRV